MLEDIVVLAVGVGLGITVGDLGAKLIFGAIAARHYNKQVKQRMETSDLANELTALFEQTYTSAKEEDGG